jgi:hypothetical protein
MKVLLLTDRMDIGGAETHVLTLMGELIKMGCELTLLTSGGVYMNELSRIFFVHSELVRKKTEQKAQNTVQNGRYISVDNHMFFPFICAKNRAHHSQKKQKKKSEITENAISLFS